MYFEKKCSCQIFIQEYKNFITLRSHELSRIEFTLYCFDYPQFQLHVRKIALKLGMQLVTAIPNLLHLYTQLIRLYHEHP